jgi:hypothetical protein
MCKTLPPTNRAQFLLNFVHLGTITGGMEFTALSLRDRRRRPPATAVSQLSLFLLLFDLGVPS